MKIRIIAILILSLISQLVAAQSKEADVETWYVWIDTDVSVDNQSMRLISSEPVAITCCVKSPKYRRYLKKTATWIQKNVDPTYSSESGIKKLQDLDLANQMINDAKTTENAKIIDYEIGCK